MTLSKWHGLSLVQLSDCFVLSNRVRAICVAMGLTPVMWTRIDAQRTFDTGGIHFYFISLRYTYGFSIDFYIESGGTTAPQVIQNWQNIMTYVINLATGFIVLEHDLFEQTVQIAAGYILPDALATIPKLTIQPVVSCLGLPMSDAYIETNDNKTNVPLISG